MLKIKILALALLLSFISFAQKSKIENIVLISVDGLRWQEVFQGADSLLVKDKKYWAKTANERRKKLMPFFWETIAEKGQLYGNRDLGNKVNVKNEYWFSYPGRSETLCGYYDPKVNSNGYPNNPNENVLEFFNNQTGYKGKVATFASWDALGRILNRDRNGMLVNLPGEDVEGTNLTEAQKLANELQHFVPEYFGECRPDALTFGLTKAYFKAQKPKVLHIDFADTDNYGHSGKYNSYLDAAHFIDGMIANLWETIQKDPNYKGKTAILVYPDHGRGVGKKWTGHGRGNPKSDETWLAALGPGIKPLGEVKKGMQIYQDQIAQTAANLLGFIFKANHPVGKSIKSILE
ncbi:alkaline phosphatase family protein [Polaribacter cellanae]|uniref:Alkaline phosphatase family protein n=1 Tax=Polaribacter cellanae TaxID=2818493 RepID=A0A975CT31_9FLAO|nr:alkaline phosphatase family protein [Polaribacter cellanae]QTE22826.1 alkaline phosphatase family protein [Polaribacter cellanae]